MKRCARYALELTIHAMLKQDRIFRLLHLGYRVEHLCIDSLHSICGSELKEIGERLPNLKSLIIKRSTFVSLPIYLKLSLNIPFLYFLAFLHN